MMQTKMMIAAIFALTLSTNAIAQRSARSPDQALALDNWVHTIDGQLSDSIGAADFMPLENDTERGMAEVRFMRGTDGKATDVTLARSSGVKSIDADALDQVKHLNHIRPLPSGISPNLHIIANFVYDTDDDSPRYMKALGAATRAEERAEARIDAGGQRP